LAALGCLGRLPVAVVAQTAALGVIVGVLAWRTGSFEGAIARYRDLRDQLTAASRRLRQMTADLAERQELELRLATADERSRIAREIHDNAGHLLTRALLQTKALAVAQPGLGAGLDELAATLDEAMETVRRSVHDLRDEAVDLEARLATLGAGTRLDVTVDYQAGEVPAAVGRAFVAIAREAVSNSLRHSDAGAVEIAVFERPGLYQLTVSDNGSRPPAARFGGRGGGGRLGESSARGGGGRGGGLDDGAGGGLDDGAGGGLDDGAGGGSGGGAGMGLATIEERARGLGGVSRVWFDDGFRVFVSAPRPSPAAPAAEPARPLGTLETLEKPRGEL
jgi:signal transduction histidine kinase